MNLTVRRCYLKVNVLGENDVVAYFCVRKCVNAQGVVHSIGVYSVCGGELINKGVNVVGTGGGGGGGSNVSILLRYEVGLALVCYKISW